MDVDKVVYRPVAKVYNRDSTGFVRTGVSNVLSNVAEVPRFGNDILQVNFPWAVTTVVDLLSTVPWAYSD